MRRVGEGNTASSVSLGNGGAKPARTLSSYIAVTPRELLAALALAIAYYGGAYVGIALTFRSEPVSMLWPPNAILLAALLLTPPRAWWLMIAGVLPAHVAVQLSLGVSLTMSLLWFVSNVAEALLGAAVTMRVLGRAPRFNRLRDLSVFLVAGVFLAPFVTSFLDAGFVALVRWRYSGEYWEVWRMRLFSNALASLTLAPLIVSWFQRGFKPLRQTTFMEHAEIWALLIGLSATSAIAFQYSGPFGQSAVLMYVPLPFLIWAAVRHGVSGVSLCVAIVAMFAIAGVLGGRGPFVSDTPQGAALALQVFLILAAASLMLLAASLAELRYAKGVAVRHRESLKLALGAAGMGTWEWDIDRDRVRWRSSREAAGSIYNGDLSQSLSKVLARVHEDDRLTLVRAIDSALEQGDGEVEYRFLSGYGDYRWITSKGKVIADVRGGKPQRMIGVYIDTTNRKLREMQARAQQEQITRLGRISILGELSGALAHELNQPLTAILIDAQAARRQLERSAPDFGQITEILDDIVSENRRAGAVIKRLRALFIRGTVQTQQVDANECIREVLALEHSYLIRHSVAADVQLAAGIPAIAADCVQLQQVLLNLILNACDAMAANEPGDRRLRIVSASNGDGKVDIEIRDRGDGIDDIETIFQPFFSTKDHGIGLGLSICRTIITAHHGRLWASNNATRGATLHISLPVASAGSTGTNGAAFRQSSAQ